MKIKKLLALVLTVAMVVSMLAMPVTAAELSDISSHWAKDSIERWVDAGVIGGYPDGTFKPDGSITRAEFATILAKAFGLTGKGDKSFSDVDSHWAKDFIYACAAAGIVGGYPDGTFLPDKAITRQEAMKMYTMALVLEGYVNPDSYAAFLENEFADADQVGEWAQAYAVAMVTNNAMQGSQVDGAIHLKPTANISRAEVAVILDRVVAVYVSATGEVSNTTQAQIDKGMMGNRVVVHTDANATVLGDGKSGFSIEAEGGSVSVEDIYEVCLVRGDFASWIYCESGYALTEDGPVYYRGYSLPYEYINTDCRVLDDGTTEEYVSSREYVYNEENWNLEQVLYYEEGELVRTITCEFDENNRPSKIMMDDILLRSFVYNEKGWVVKEVSYRDDGKEDSINEYIYDADGHMIEDRYTYYNYWYDYQYDDNGDLIVDDEGNPIEVEVKNEHTSYHKYTYDDQGRQLGYQQFNNKGIMVSERLYEYDENGDRSKEHYKSYSMTYYEDEKVESWLSYEEIYLYEEGRESEYQWTDYNEGGAVVDQGKHVYFFDEEGRSTKREEYEMDQESGELKALGTYFVEYTDESWRRSATYYKTADGVETWKRTYEYTETEESDITKEYYYEQGKLVSYSIEEHLFESGENWSTEYDAEDNVIYKSYYFTEELENDAFHHHSEYEYPQDNDGKDMYDEYYFYVLLPENYNGNNWDYYYY